MKCQIPPPDSVDAWFAELTPFAKPICEALRKLIRQACPGLGEQLKWGSPSYCGNGLVCGLGAFKQHVTLHFFRGRELPNPDGLLTYGEGNASSRSVKFRSLEDLKPAGLRRLLKAAVELDRRQQQTPALRARRPPLPVPDDLAAALGRAPAAASFFESLPPSHKREYLEWIIEAKRPDTRSRRLESAVSMLAAGRRRNEEYRR